MQNPRSLLIACFLHVINLCAQEMIKALNKTPEIDPDNEDDDFDNVNDETFDKQTIKGSLLWKPITALLEDAAFHNLQQKYALTSEEWECVANCVNIPHKAQMVMVSKKLPVLSLAIPAFEKFMSQLEKLIKEQPRLVPIILPALTRAIKYYKKMDNTTAYLVNLFLHPGI
ncbi:hypothetical protein DXG01_006954 [Tephrocybe rancida]|nr:hypothetical protein DXG01_006954 [Tephrocybe rancida]